MKKDHVCTRDADGVSVLRLLEEGRETVPHREWDTVSRERLPRLDAKALLLGEPLHDQVAALAVTSEQLGGRWAVLLNDHYLVPGPERLCGGWILIHDRGVVRRWQSVLVRINEVRRVQGADIDDRRRVRVFESDSLSAWDGTLPDTGNVTDMAKYRMN